MDKLIDLVKEDLEKLSPGQDYTVEFSKDAEGELRIKRRFTATKSKAV